MQVYDMIVLGGGPAGYTAALYAVRAGLRTLVVEQLAAGGQMTQTARIDNYPGFDTGVDGFELGEKMRAGAERFGARTVYAQITGVELAGEVKRVETTEGTFLAKTAVLATGAGHKQLGLDREEELTGRGVAYCAACDAMFYRGKTVAVVGGGNSALEDALVLSRLCEKVVLIHRRDSLRGARIYRDQVAQTPNIEIRWNSRLRALLGQEKVTGVALEDVQTGEVRDLALDGLFISIGRSPATELFAHQVTLDSQGYIQADETTQTNLPGVYAVGDVRTKPLRQIVTATADGAVAAYLAEQYLSTR